MKRREYEVDYSKDYQKVHDLVYEYKAGSLNAADALLECFGKFLSNYAALIKLGKYNLNYYSIRSFIISLVSSLKAVTILK